MNTPAAQPLAASGSGKVGRHRWLIVGLLFAATAINYVDRQMIGVLKPTLQGELKWSELDYANVVFWFQTAYAVGYLAFGKIVDRIGARLGYALAFVIWTLAHMAHGLVGNVLQFSLVRIGLGLGESGNFPAGVKAATEWFPAKERALAVGIYNAGANVGAIITPLIVPILTLKYGWRAAFVITGAVSFVWLLAWLSIYRTPRQEKRLSSAELEWIESDPPDPATPLPWLKLVRIKETWAYALGKFCIDPIWWFYLFWLPGVLATRYGLDLTSFGPPLVAIYLLSDAGSVLGGWASSRMMKAGKSVNFSRKIAMLGCAIAVTPIFFAQHIRNLWVAVCVIGVAAAAHQAFSANLYTLPSDLFPRSAVGSVIGIGGTIGAIGGMLFALYTGYVLDKFGSYAPIFVVAGSAYFVALALVHQFSPALKPVEASAS